MAAKKLKKGQTGAYPRSAKAEDRRAVEVTAVNNDGTVNLGGLGPNVGVNGAGEKTTNPNPWTVENVPAAEFVSDDEAPEPEGGASDPTP